MAPKLNLKKTQHWMQTVIMHPGTDQQAVAAKKSQALVSKQQFPQLVLPSRTLNSFQRIGIYRDMYLARLREALASDYPALLHYMGDDAFTQLVVNYVQKFPSQSYTLNRLGDRLPIFIRSLRGLRRREFLYDLARLELAISEVFDAAESPALKPKPLLNVSLEAWEETRLKPIEGFRLLEFQYPVNAYLQSFRDGSPHPSLRRKSNWVVIFRKNYKVKRLDLTRQAYDLLKSLASGKPMGKALSLSLSRHPTKVSEVQLYSWFREWVANGLFQDIEQDS